MNDADVVVVGAGPAGAIAALVLARAGARVRLLDRDDFPRHKLCGDTVNPGALAILDGLGVGERIRARSLPVTGMTVTGPDGTAITSDYPHALAGAAITRQDLDLLLVEAAVCAGVQFEPGVAVDSAVIGEQGRVTGVRVRAGTMACRLNAAVVIAADGRASKVARSLGLSALARRPRRWAHGAYFTGVDGMTARGEMHVRRGSYIGVAPLPGGVANVCFVNHKDHKEHKDEGMERDRRSLDRRDPARIVIEAVAADPVLRARFTHARQVTPVTTLGPLAVESRACGCPGLLLAGDAAGFVDPMTGDGLRFAIRGGTLAADAALGELGTGKPSFDLLRAARAREFSAKWRINRALRVLVGSPNSVALATLVASRWPAPIQYLVGVAGDVSLARREP